MRKDWHRKEQENTLEEGKRRIVLSVSYNGMLFNGWQAQEDKSAVQDKVEEAILKQSKRLLDNPDDDISELKLVDFNLDDE